MRALCIGLLASCLGIAPVVWAEGSTPDAGASVSSDAAMLIWGGGTTRDQAQHSLETYRQRATDWASVLVLSEGFPKIIESRTVPGLNPGFFVVVLGVCQPGKEAEPLAAYKGVEPDVYARPVQWKSTGALPCPALGEGWSRPHVERVKQKGLELTGVVFTYDEVGEGGEFENKGWLLLVTLRDAKGKLLDDEPLKSAFDYDELRSLSVRGKRLVLEEEYADPGCFGGPTFSAYRRVVRFEAKGQKLASDDDEKLLKEGDCGDYGGD